MQFKILLGQFGFVLVGRGGAEDLVNVDVEVHLVLLVQLHHLFVQFILGQHDRHFVAGFGIPLQVVALVDTVEAFLVDAHVRKFVSFVGRYADPPAKSERLLGWLWVQLDDIVVDSHGVELDEAGGVERLSANLFYCFFELTFGFLVHLKSFNHLPIIFIHSHYDDSGTFIGHSTYHLLEEYLIPCLLISNPNCLLEEGVLIFDLPPLKKYL